MCQCVRPDIKRRKLPKVVSREPLQIGLQKLEERNPDTPLIVRKKKVYENFKPFFFRLHLAEISAKTLKHQLFDTKFVKILSFSIKMNFGGDSSAEETRRRSM